MNYWSATVSLPITLCRTLGKVFAQRKVTVTVSNGGDGVFAEWQTNRHSAKGALVSPITVSVSSVWAGTRQRSLCRVSDQQALGKGSLFVECHWVHSTKSLSLSLVAVTTTCLCWAPDGTRQRFCQAPDKKYSTKKPLSMYNSLRLLCQEFSGRCRVCEALGKTAVSSSD